ncbi:uncharacterized protein LOC111284274 [Durio zibethinus]|uniref:Uncharacterized protein LOC111284274 n=1 Tax=Durio zibethinus TaxID=66656 RepID=A0A6P5XLD5_DURZI|nr:uncharacterized protein LOC111284274 [Durio zibethinus]
MALTSPLATPLVKGILDFTIKLICITLHGQLRANTFLFSPPKSPPSFSTLTLALAITTSVAGFMKPSIQWTPNANSLYRFIPIINGVYVSRIAQRKSLAGFEAIRLALYAHETTARGGQPVIVHVPDLSRPSIYHESKPFLKNISTGPNLTVMTPSLEPHGTTRSTRRAWIVGVALELYCNKISQMPAGQAGDNCKDGEVDHGKSNGSNDQIEKVKKKERRIPLPWELLQPSLRKLGHCLLGPHRSMEIFYAASSATRSFVLRLEKVALDPTITIDYTEIEMTNVTSL